VDFIDAHRRAQCVALAALLEPGVVVPLEMFAVPDDGRLLGRDLEEKSERVGVQLDVAVRVADLKFVMRTLSHAGNENFPHAGRAEQPHRMKPPVPVVEIADDADALGVWRPDGKAGAGHAINHAQLRAELLENFTLVALAEEEQVRFAQRRQKGKGVARAARFASFIGDDEVVGIDLVRQFGDGLKDIGFGNPLQFKRRLVLFMRGCDFNFGGVGKQGADDEAGFIAQRVHSQQRVRRLVGQLNQTM
jgi:hypothetical protein